MTRHKKELMECARMLKLGNLAEHLEELLHQAQEKQLTYPEFLLACLREEVRTGKTYIAARLVHEAVKNGYRAYMVTLEDLLTCLKTRDVSGMR